MLGQVAGSESENIFLRTTNVKFRKNTMHA